MALARVHVNVMMISQASSEHNVCVVIPQKDCARAVKELRAEFEIDIARRTIDDIKLQEPMSIVAVVGEGMKGLRGIAGRTFSAVAKAGVNIVAIAQGSSELNISLLVEQADARKAVEAIHELVVRRFGVRWLATALKAAARRLSHSKVAEIAWQQAKKQG